MTVPSKWTGSALSFHLSMVCEVNKLSGQTLLRRQTLALGLIFPPSSESNETPLLLNIRGVCHFLLGLRRAVADGDSRLPP